MPTFDQCENRAISLHELLKHHFSKLNVVTPNYEYELISFKSVPVTDSGKDNDWQLVAELKDQSIKGEPILVPVDTLLDKDFYKLLD
jgi:hypothetical protein